MKKILAILFILLLAFTLAACKKEGDVQPVENPEDAAVAIEQVSQDVEDVSATLEGIDKDLSGK